LSALLTMYAAVYRSN